LQAASLVGLYEGSKAGKGSKVGIILVTKSTTT